MDTAFLNAPELAGLKAHWKTMPERAEDIMCKLRRFAEEHLPPLKSPAK